MDILPLLFNSKARASVLQLLFGFHERSMYLNEMVQVIGMASRSIEVELKNLTKMGLLTATRDRSRIYYQANESHSAYSGLKTLIADATPFLARLQESLAWSDIEFAFIPSQDSELIADSSRQLPLVILTQPQPRNLNGLLQATETQLGRKLEAEVLTVDEVRCGLSAGTPRIVEVFRATKSFVIGRQDRLTERITPGDSAQLNPSSSTSP